LSGPAFVAAAQFRLSPPHRHRERRRRADLPLLQWPRDLGRDHARRNRLRRLPGHLGPRLPVGL